jgi:DNA ligase (NAD+)
VAELEPVELAGTTVKRATLHNADEIARQDVRIGDLVSIEKGGEIIPKVTGVLKDRRSGREQAFRFPTRCPVCAEPLEREEGHVAIRCLNEHCPAQLKRRILHFAARGALDIAGLGAALVDQLVDREIVEDVADLFSLQQSQIAGLERMGEKSVQNILAAIEESKRRDLARLIFALGIRHVGTHAARLLAQSYSSIRQLARADPEELAAIEEIGPVIADSVHRYLRRKETRALLRKLAQAGVSLAEEERPPPAGTLGGLTFVLTGTLVEMTRREAQRLIESQGGRVASSVSSRTNYLLAGTDPGSKLRKAQQLGVTVLDLPGLQRLIAVRRHKA